MLKKSGSHASPPAPRKDPVLAGLAFAALALFAFWAFAPVLSADFINFDDGDYVLSNPQVRAGLSPKGALWALTATHASNWHPLTWASHMLDVSLFEMNAGAHHRTNVLLHLANAGLLLLALRRLTGRFWPSLVVAGLFALHPLRVESVAWVAERKDVLSGFFFFLALYLYAGYGRRLALKSYLALAAVTALGLMAKSMLVTLPCVLLLLDYWPLARFARREHAKARGDARHKVRLKQRPAAKRKAAKTAPLENAAPQSRAIEGFTRCVLEKIPLLLLSGGTAWLTILASRQAGALASLQELGLASRVANACAAYAQYLAKLLAPTGLAVYYPIRAVPAWEAGLAVALLVGITAAAVWLRRRAPYVLVGWLWFLGMLAPVVGLVQVGGQAMADRYTYLPAVGLYLAVVWGAAELMERFDRQKLLRPAVASLLVLAIVALGLATRTQAGYWKNTETLYERTLAVTEKNFIIHYNYASFLSAQGREAEALAQYEASLAAHPGYAKSLNNAAWLLATSADPALRNPARSVELARKGVAVAGANPGMLDTLAAALAAAGDYAAAADTAREAEARAVAAGSQALAADIGSRRELYAQGLPYHAKNKEEQ